VTPTLDALTTTMTTAMTTTQSTTTVADGSPTDGNTGECSLLGSFALLVQAALGALAMLSLVYKRWKERPQRPVKIWFFDVSKQVFGSVMVHMANIFMSLLTSGRFSIVEPTPPHLSLARNAPYVPNPCSFYLLNLGIDTTLGIPILIFLLHVTTKVVSYTPIGKPPESIQSGYYGNPPNAWWWLKQSVIYFCGLFGMKIVVLIIFLVFPWISRVGDWALGWTEGNEKLQIIFVMMLFPLIMNAVQYYIIDSFIKKQTDPNSLPFDDSEDRAALTGGCDELLSDSLSDSGEESETDYRMHSAKHQRRHPRQQGRREYDPHTDGDSQTIVGSSRGSRPNSYQTGTLLSKDL